MTRDRFLHDLLQGSAPLLVWALHFFGAYVLLATVCCRSAEPLLATLLLLAAALALLGIGLLLLRTRRLRRGLLRSAGAGSAALAALGVLWTTLPVLWLPACHCA